jgi:hypothetical protein
MLVYCALGNPLHSFYCCNPENVHSITLIFCCTACCAPHDWPCYTFPATNKITEHHVREWCTINSNFNANARQKFLPLISAELMAFLATFAALPDGALPSCLELPWRS